MKSLTCTGNKEISFTYTYSSTSTITMLGLTMTFGSSSIQNCGYAQDDLFFVSIKTENIILLFNLFLFFLFEIKIIFPLFIYHVLIFRLPLTMKEYPNLIFFSIHVSFIECTQCEKRKKENEKLTYFVMLI